MHWHVFAIWIHVCILIILYLIYKPVMYTGYKYITGLKIKYRIIKMQTWMQIAKYIYI